ncbi:triosephosphate isomerase [Neolewinella xylanilytica]|uniref:Triosephosphate isomerase n=1 Tax=Neolewinella xylanilytica TaxID=1514080 RepID=A0A2S6I697_9BACT|nr:triose-phosphate isomerase [Neolewinella xylanilytica]PPK86692.1 triosephosphate isomerase [Neolewinella xylanilytica]
MSRTMVAGNWKMNTTPSQGASLIREVMEKVGTPATRVVFGVPAIQLMQAQELVAGHTNYALAAQNMHQEANGAYTGEISAEMLTEVGIEYVILGHSERRDYAGEDDDLINVKIQRALEAGLQPIYCCGEKLDIREAGNQELVVGKQVEQALYSLDPDQISKVIIAYEPVWAIGTGVTASKEQAQEMHASIRRMIANQFGTDVAQNMTILYGGSVKPNNAKELFDQPDVDGGLVGGASLDADSFAAIILAAGS